MNYFTRGLVSRKIKMEKTLLLSNILLNTLRVFRNIVYTVEIPSFSTIKLNIKRWQIKLSR